MDISTQMSSQAEAKLTEQVRNFNRGLTGKAESSQDLGKDDFLKILITQLSHQDPTDPMKDKEFISQMAQFSSLEQMNNMASQMEGLSKTLSSGQTVGLLGRTVEAVQGEGTVTGRVEAISGGENPQLIVNGRNLDTSQIIKVME